MDRRYRSGRRESMDGGGPGPLFVASYGGGLCSAVDVYGLMIIMMMNILSGNGRKQENTMISGVISTLAAFVLGTFNLAVMVLCLFLFSVSLWTISSPSTISTSIQVAGSPTLTALLPPEVLTVQHGVGTAALVTFLFIIAFMGLYGAVSRSQYVLCMYSTLVLLLLLLECALTYYFSSSLIEKGLQERDGQWTHAMRLVFRCCDVKNSTQETLKPPWSCCGTDYYPENCTVASVYEKDCQVTISSWIDRYITAVYASLAVLHLVLASCALLRRCSRWHS